MRAVIVIIDFDNYFGADVSKLNSDEIEFSFKEIIKTCEKEFSNFNYIKIRLYGGWYKENTFTKQASGVQQLLRQISVFPKVNERRILNGNIELATSLYIKPDFIWGYTHKETNGIKRIRVNHESVDIVCKENRSHCPKYLLYKFTDSKDKLCHVDGCFNLQKNVFKGAEQKMVDTIIACDVISSSEDDSVSGILIISDDQDHLPALAQASLKKNENSKSIILGLRNVALVEFMSNFMLPFNIKTASIHDSRRN